MRRVIQGKILFLEKGSEEIIFERKPAPKSRRGEINGVFIEKIPEIFSLILHPVEESPSSLPLRTLTREVALDLQTRLLCRPNREGGKRVPEVARGTERPTKFEFLCTSLP